MAKTTSTERITTPRTSTASTLLYTFEREAIRPTRRLRRTLEVYPRFTPRSPRCGGEPKRSLPLRSLSPSPSLATVPPRTRRPSPWRTAKCLNLAAATQCASVVSVASAVPPGFTTATTAPASSHDDGDGRLHQRRLLRGRVDDALPFVQSHGERDGNARDRHLAPRGRRRGVFVFVGVRVVRPSRLCRFRFPSPPVWTFPRSSTDAKGTTQSRSAATAARSPTSMTPPSLSRQYTSRETFHAQRPSLMHSLVRSTTRASARASAMRRVACARLLGRSSRSGGRGTHRGKLDGDLEDAEVEGVQSGRHGLELDRGDGGGASNLGERGALGGGHDAARQAHGPRATERSPVRSRALGDELIIVLFGVQSLVRRRLHRPRAAQRRVARGGGERSGGRRGI